MKLRIQQQRGAALISALLLMAVAATVATWCYLQQHVWLRQAQLVMQADRLQAALEDARAWALQVAATPNLPRVFPRFHQHQQGITVEASVVSEGGRFDINNVQSSEHVLHFVFLLQAIDARLHTNQAIRLAYDLNAWMSPTARLERYYLALHPPYRQAHRKMVQWNELRLVRGMTVALYRELTQGKERYITALPQQQSLDVNYISAPVLASVTSLSNEEAERVIRCRDMSPPFRSPEDFIARCAKDLPIELHELTAESSFFLFQAHAEVSGVQRQLTALLQRISTKQGPSIKIVWQEWNDV